MQVKKFEAQTMKDALEMVRNQLGPDAIILSARDNQKSFGLLGKGSVEVTAAVSEMQLRKLQFAEAKLREADKKKFKSSTARMQKKFIEKSVKRTMPQDSASLRQSALRYIDIQDEEGFEARTYAPPPEPPLSKGRRVDDLLKDYSSIDTGKRRVQEAVKTAWQAVQATVEVPAKQETPAQPNLEVQILKSEIRQLKEVIESLKTKPSQYISMHPGASRGIPFELSSVYERLLQSGLNEEIVIQNLQLAMRDLPPAQLGKKPFVEAWVARHLMSALHVVEKPFENRVHLFMGPSGQGKTSSLVKVASHLSIKEKKKVAILSADTTKVAGADQLRIYAQILNVPFAIVRSRHDWEQILYQLSSCDYILVDFPGLSLKSLQEIELLKSLLPPENIQRTTHYVQSITCKDADALDLSRRFRFVNPSDIIFTNLDESNSHGIIYNLNQTLNLPLHSFGIGPVIPDDFEIATRERVIDLIFKITKIKNV